MAGPISLQSGPYQPELILPRAALGLANLAWLDGATTVAFRAEFLRAMAQAPEPFVADVVRSGQVAAVREILRARPEQRRRFDQLAAQTARLHEREGPAS
jgi:acyl-coenzyme A thioesterase PaaI-like protein